MRNFSISRAAWRRRRFRYREARGGRSDTQVSMGDERGGTIREQREVTMIARSGLTGNVFRKVVARRRPLSRSAVLVYLVVAAGILAAYSATASAANYQNGALRSCPKSN